MKRRDVVRLQRLLAGELSAQQERELRDRMAVEADLRRQFESLERTWSELDLPDTQPAPLGYAQSVSRAAASRASERVRWSMAPVWAQATAAAALAGGIVLGLGLGGTLGSGDGVVADRGVAVSAEVEMEMTLAESYWQLLDETASDPFASDGSP